MTYDEQFGHHPEPGTMHETNQILRDILAVIRSQGQVLEEMANDLEDIVALLTPESSATRLTMTTTQGDTPMSTFTIDTTDGAVNFQFTDDHGDPVAGPNDSVTGTPIAPSASSDNPDVVTAGVSAPGATDGAFTQPLTMVGVGSANISADPLVNSDGSPVVDAAGNPFTSPDPQAVTVTGGPATGFTMALAG